MDREPFVILTWNESGICGVQHSEGVRVFSIDEGAPHDRVYRFATPEPLEWLEALIADARIGSRHDERHAACVARIDEVQTGKPRLMLVPRVPGDGDGQQG